MNVLNLLEEVGIQAKLLSSTNGGEFHSKCPDPACDGVDRFCIWPKLGNSGRYWCRRCLRHGDAIQFCRDFLNLSFKEACEKVGTQCPSWKPALKYQKIFIPKVKTFPAKGWCQKANAFIQQCQQNLLKAPNLLNQEKDRGLTLYSIQHFQIGWNPNDTFEPRLEWGLPEASETGTRQLCLPKGIVIPSFRESEPIRIKIRRSDWGESDKYPKYQVINGGSACPIFLGDSRKPCVVVEAELDAMLIQEKAADLCSCIALGGVSIRPDEPIDKILRHAPLTLFALDFDDAGKKAYSFWRSNYSNLRPWPVPKGKSPGDAYLQGTDIRQWVQTGINQYIKEKICTTPHPYS